MDETFIVKLIIYNIFAVKLLLLVNYIQILYTLMCFQVNFSWEIFMVQFKNTKSAKVLSNKNYSLHGIIILLLFSGFACMYTYACPQQVPFDEQAKSLMAMYVCICMSQLCNPQGHDTYILTLICFAWCGIHALCTLMYVSKQIHLLVVDRISLHLEKVARTPSDLRFKIVVLFTLQFIIHSALL